jgi:hypothetical protein
MDEFDESTDDLMVEDEQAEAARYVTEMEDEQFRRELDGETESDTLTLKEWDAIEGV